MESNGRKMRKPQTSRVGPARRRLATVAIGLCAAGLVAALGSSSSSANGGITKVARHATAAAAAIPAGPITIGAIYPVTGEQAAVGQDQNAGVKASIQAINASGGVLGHKLVEKFLDDAAVPSQTALDARQLIGDHVAGIIGSSINDNVLAEQPVITQAHMPTFIQAPLDSAPTSPWMYLVGDTNTQQAENYASYLVKVKKLHKIGVIYLGNAYGLSGLSATKAYFKSVHVDLVASQSESPTATDVSAQLTALRSAGAQGIVAFSYGPPMVAIITSLQAIGWNPPVSTPPGSAAPTVVQAVEAAKLTSVSGGDTPKSFLVDTAAEAKGDGPPKVAAFLKAYFANGGTPGDQVNAVTPYDSVQVLAQAIERAKSVSPAAVQAALNSGTRFSGIGGTYTFHGTNHAGSSLSDLGLFAVPPGCPKLCVAAPGE